MASSNNHVAEMQGLYGPYTMAERVVQKIWLQRDFDQTNARLTDGRALEVRSTGVWNLLSGPDFRGARLVIDGREIIGDVEVHFHAADWRAHGHETDRAYDNVALHVVLFPLENDERPAVRGDGERMLTLVLLPLLHRDLEEYASDDALETITARDEWRYFAERATRPPEELQALLMARAKGCWRQKVHFAGLRIDKLGWRVALHHAALEMLGYRHNRAAMLAVAAKYPLEAWSEESDVMKIFVENKPGWQLRGVRPANHPLLRLQQYRRWMMATPDWPNQVAHLLTAVPATTDTGPTKFVRQALQLGKFRKTLVDELLGRAIGGTRLDNFVCDGLLPLLAASTKQDLFALWFHWFLGDVPDQVRRTLPKLGLADGRLQPLCNGYARGLLSWFLECEARASS